MKKWSETLFVVVAPGLEQVCAVELAELTSAELRIVPGGIEFEGGLRELYLANLWLRTASRVLVRVGEIKSRDFPDLFRKSVKLPWGRFVRPETRVRVKAVSHHSRLNHTGRIAESIVAAVDRALGRETPPAAGEEQTVLARFENDRCLLSVDSSGEILHRRGYRTETAHAPLRETLAAGILKLMDWDGTVPLFDPMCGSGSFVIEAAQIALRRAPGLDRDFAFRLWPGYRQGLWDALAAEAKKQELSPATLTLSGADADIEAVEAARRNADRAGVGELVSFHHKELGQFAPEGADGLLVCNPPYGKRVGKNEDLFPLYQRFGALLREGCKGWQGALVCPDERLAKQTGYALRKKALLHNGGIPVHLFALR